MVNQLVHGKYRMKQQSLEDLMKFLLPCPTDLRLDYLYSMMSMGLQAYEYTAVTLPRILKDAYSLG
jgi:hypothetical protein